jgi:hypothetical protein
MYSPENLHAVGGTAAVVGGALMAGASICRVMFKSDAMIMGFGIAGALLIVLGIFVAFYGYRKHWKAQTDSSYKDPVYWGKVLTAGLFAAIAIWSFVLIVSDPITEDVSGFTLTAGFPLDPYCGRRGNTELYLDPAFMDVGAAGNSIIDIMFSLLMAIGMLSYYLPAVGKSDFDFAEKCYSVIAYVFLCAASVANVGLCVTVHVFLGNHQSPFSTPTLASRRSQTSA